MTITPTQISSETVQALNAQAAAAGLSADQYLKQLLGSSQSAQPQAADSIEEFTNAMESLAEPTVQPLPRDFSREDIYFPEN